MNVVAYHLEGISSKTSMYSDYISKLKKSDITINELEYEIMNSNVVRLNGTIYVHIKEPALLNHRMLIDSNKILNKVPLFSKFNILNKIVLDFIEEDNIAVGHSELQIKFLTQYIIDSMVMNLDLIYINSYYINRKHVDFNHLLRSYNHKAVNYNYYFDIKRLDNTKYINASFLHYKDLMVLDYLINHYSGIFKINIKNIDYSELSLNLKSYSKHINKLIRSGALIKVDKEHIVINTFYISINDNYKYISAVNM